jgi:hypothetical protein
LALLGEVEGSSSATVQALLDRLTRKPRGAVLLRVPVRGGFSYRFQTQMIRHYVLLRHALATQFPGFQAVETRVADPSTHQAR